LTLESWISNGTDLINAYFVGTKPRLLPTIPLGVDEFNGKNRVVFQPFTSPQALTYYDSVALKQGAMGPFTGQYANMDWLSFGGVTWGGKQFGEMVFELDENGRAMSVELSAFRITLEMKGKDAGENATMADMVAGSIGMREW
jgi:hypothetical protein